MGYQRRVHGDQLSDSNIRELTMMILLKTLAALLVVTAVSAKSKNPIVSFDSDKVTAKESPVPVAEVEPTTADVNTPERLAALVSGIYSASNGYRPTPADLRTVAQIADQKIAFEDLNDQQLGVIGSVIGALQTGAIKSSDSDKDYIQLNIAPEAPKVPSGLYASVEMDPSAGYYAPQGYPQYSQKFYPTSGYSSGYPSAYSSGYPSGYPAHQRYPVSYRQSPYSGGYASSGFMTASPFRYPSYGSQGSYGSYPSYPSYQGYPANSGYESPLGYSSYPTSGYSFRRPATPSGSQFVVRNGAGDYLIVDQRTGIAKKITSEATYPSAASKFVVRTSGGDTLLLDQGNGNIAKLSGAEAAEKSPPKSKVVVQTSNGDILLINNETGEVKKLEEAPKN